MDHRLDCIQCDRAFVAHVKRFNDKFAVPLCEDCIRPLEAIKRARDNIQGYYYIQV